MSQRATVDDLFASIHKRLTLEWVAGRVGGAQVIEPDDAPQRRELLIGYLNLINPKRVQILGITEMHHLDGLGPEAYRETVEQLFGASTVLVIVTDGQTVPRALARHAEGSGTALMTTGMPGHDLLARLRFDLHELLATRLTLHGVFIEVLGVGVLITGASGVGKSELALDLIARGHRLIADDAPEFTRVAPDLIMGSCPEPLGDFLEVRGLGILNVRMMYGDNAVKSAKYLGLIVHLLTYPADDPPVERLDSSPAEHIILDVPIPEVPLYVDPVRNLAVLVEAAVRSHLLRKRGYDATHDLTDRQQRLLGAAEAEQ